jgi:uncharacterized membrane protein YphA (DoxX/SURF4 family)
MNPILQFLRGPAEAPRSVLLVRIAVGLIFFTQGILKYIDPNLGVVRFTRIGFPHPYFTAQFVGTFEILCGLLLLVGLWTKLVSIPVLIVIMTAIATTKIPEVFRAHLGFWYMVAGAAGRPPWRRAVFLSDSFPIDWEHTDKDQELGKLMRGYWVEFAKPGDPNLDSAPHWTPYDVKSKEYFELGKYVGVHRVSERVLALESIMNEVVAQ